MRTSRHAKPKATSGTANAKVNDDEDVEQFEGTRFFFYLDEKTNRWDISASSADNQQGQYQVISLQWPNEGNVEGKTYGIVFEHNMPGTANASWAKANSASYRPYPAISGSVTVTLNTTLQTVELTFDFKGVSGSKTVSLTQGKMHLQGFTEERKTRAIGSMECDLSESLNEHYKSTETGFNKKGETGSFPAYLQAWSQQFSSKPDRKNHQISINIANGLLPGTYNFHPGSQQVRIFFTNVLEGISWLADKGTITFKSIPDFADITGKLSGEFNFEASAELTDGSLRFLKVENGTFDTEQ